MVKVVNAVRREGGVHHLNRRRRSMGRETGVSVSPITDATWLGRMVLLRREQDAADKKYLTVMREV